MKKKKKDVPLQIKIYQNVTVHLHFEEKPIINAKKPQKAICLAVHFNNQY